ncbi:MAG: alkaline phosphatase family protein [Bryobacterales bacterium]|nr:alkaline phosphatase family protein [Bryobacterales bacterium]
MSAPTVLRRRAAKVVLIGFDAADWNLIHPLLDAGQMPHLERFVESGVMGNLASLQPMLSPMLWTSIATGKRPYKHGIHGFVEPDPSGQSLRAVSSTSRTTKALWNILSQAGLRTAVAGWYAGHPVEPILGVAVSEHFPKPVGGLQDAWPVPPGMVHPPELAETLAECRVHPEEIDGYSLLPFVPQAATIDQSKDSRLGALATDLAECLSTHAVTTWMMENTEWDFLAAYFPAIDHLGHKFMYYHPPRMECISEEEFELYRNVMAEAYRFHDQLLGRILELAGEDAAIILCSDHGYHSDHLRPAFTPNIPSGPTRWHRPYGILAMRGPGILSDERIFGASLLDIAPTVLHLLGLPVGADMDGRVLAQAFADPPANIPAVPSWDHIPGDSGQHPVESRQDLWDGAAAYDQLVALGYVSARSESVATDIRRAEQEAQYNLAVAFIDGGRVAEAIPVLERIYKECPENSLYGLHLATAYQRQGSLRDARRTAEAVIARSQDENAEPFGRPRMAEPPGKSTEGPRLEPQVDLLLGMLDLDEGKAESAMQHLQRAQASNNAPPETFCVIGQTLVKMSRWVDAIEAFQKALLINPHDPRAHAGMAQALLGVRRNEEAAGHALDAVGLRHQFPAAHYLLGVALFRLRMLDRSAEAFEQCLTLSGKRMAIAGRWLERIRRIQAHQAASR